jgi:hypothetical protein
MSLEILHSESTTHSSPKGPKLDLTVSRPPTRGPKSTKEWPNGLYQLNWPMDQRPLQNGYTPLAQDQNTQTVSHNSPKIDLTVLVPTPKFTKFCQNHDLGLENPPEINISSTHKTSKVRNSDLSVRRKSTWRYIKNPQNPKNEGARPLAIPIKKKKFLNFFGALLYISFILVF